MQEENINISSISKGLHTDNSPVNQPKDTMRFALNAVNETEDGDSTFISNENSNQECFSLPSGYHPIGQVYVGNNQTVIFSVSFNNERSEIGIVEDCNYTQLVNTDVLGFTRTTLIDATYRLRRGCERVIYWTDPKIRHFNIDRPENFKTSGLTQAEINDPLFGWVESKFFLVKRYNSIPKFSSFDIQEKGSLLPGSYNFAVQYLDENLNPTEWITSSEVITIYNDILVKKDIFDLAGNVLGTNLASSDGYKNLRGSSNLKNDAKDFPKTNKSITVNLSDLDIDFAFYRLAIIEATNATGQISSVKLSRPIPTNNSVFSYNGSNFQGETTIEELQLFKNSIVEAKSIEQIENRLVLGNVKTSNTNFCKLQKYASKITSNLVTKLADNSKSQSVSRTAKDPLLKVNNYSGYVPGEIYSFGIQYYFEDNTISPVYHIPGRNSSFSSDMSTDNELENTTYNDNSFCEDYWGVDSEGATLKGQNVRHHRFPSRIDAGEALLGTTIPRLFGIEFSNIEKPSLVDTGGLEVIGYQIVQNERTDDNITIIDSALLTPVIEQNNYKANSILIADTPDLSKISTTLFQYISPQDKFKNLNINPSIVEKVGEVTISRQSLTSVITQDVAPGTSYDPEVHRRRDRDTDGFDLHSYNMVYECNSSELVAKVDYAGQTSSNIINKIIKLNSLDSDVEENLYNTVSDSKASFIKFTDPLLGSDVNARAEFDRKIPIVILKRIVSDPYSNFRFEPYYAASQIQDFTNPIETTQVYNGDSYISNIIYNATSLYDISVPNRQNKRGLWNAILGVISIIVGAVLIATGVGAGAGVMAIGFGISQLSTGVKKENIAKVLQEEYEKGLKSAVEETTITPDFNASPNVDDEIRWFSTILTSTANSAGITRGLTLESSVRLDLREGLTNSGLTDFLNTTESSFDEENDPGGATNLYKANPTLIQDYYLLNKLTVIDSETEAGYLYKGYPNAEIYDLNPDYERINNGKIFFHLGLEYDCCSDCVEDFPHRVYYSEQAFQEELADNYRFFLPNNYRDIEGEKGVIKDIFRIQNNLYIHTEESLWHLPQNIQERVTGDIISFIGTGSFFSIPPRKVVDDSKSSAGTLNKWSRIKTPHGVFFVSYIDKKIYQFTGQLLNPISDYGMSNWFRKNIQFSSNASDIDNTLLGTGFRSAYDSTKERVLFTKRDNIIQNDSWTISYCLKTKSWISWHSYTPTFYFYIRNQFYSYNNEIDITNTPFYVHNKKGEYQTFYGTLFPYIVEYVSLSNPLINKIWDHIVLQTEAKEYVTANEDFKDNRFITFNKALLYNTRQSTGELNLISKNTQSSDGNYLPEQITNQINNILLDRNERDWSFNDLRDIVIEPDESLFLKDLSSRNSLGVGYIDKIINPLSLDINKSWTELESFRDKYLVIRLIFDNFDNIRLITNYSVESEKRSIR